jgi:hypothetical protein
MADAVEWQKWRMRRERIIILQHFKKSHSGNVCLSLLFIFKLEKE